MASNNEIERRRTFAIIAHPDAGKTSLTEKLLLFGGQIQVAGAVKSNKIKKTATSDWMDIEKQRGISVTTSVMEFDYHDYKINILDTPGHQDFAEDTYRTLTAVDSVIIVVDGAKGQPEAHSGLGRSGAGRRRCHYPEPENLRRCKVELPCRMGICRPEI